MFCEHCGSSVSKTANFCSECGFKLNANADLNVTVGIKEVVVDCGHCRGTGTCKCGDSWNGGINSCRSCQSKAGLKFSSNIVPCSRCNGSGKQILTK